MMFKLWDSLDLLVAFFAGAVAGAFVTLLLVNKPTPPPPSHSTEACETLGDIRAITRRLEMHEDFMKRLAKESRR
jgi:hypothetical protein